MPVRPARVRYDDRTAAETELKSAITLCESDNDDACAADARRLQR